MLRRSLIPVVMFVLGAASVLAWQWTARGPASDEQPQTARTLTKLGTVAQAPAQPMQTQDAIPADDANPVSDANNASPSQAATSPVPVSPERLARLSADATGQDARARAAAIVALGSAPKADAAPVLEKVLSVADDADRPLALRSLRTLAQKQGDSDDRIRSVVRKVLYHESDETFTQAAQATLDDIENDLNPATRNVKRR